MVYGKHEKGEDNVVSQILREERTDRSVDNTGGKDSFFARSAFSLEVRAGDSSDSVESFLKVYRKGEKVNAVARSFGSRGTAEYSGIAVSYKNRTVCETCHFSRFNDERTTGKVIGKGFIILKHLS